MNVFSVRYDGEVVSRDLWRKDFLRLFPDLNIRDLRPVFSPMQVSTIMPRGGTVIINLGFIKCILSTDEAYFIVHRSEDKVRALCERVAAGSGNTEREPFVLFVLDKLLEAKITQMRSHITEIETTTERTLDQIRTNFSEAHLESLFADKKTVSKNTAHITEMRSAAEDVLDDEEGHRRNCGTRYECRVR